ncbi:MAG: hypothetical protein RI894_57 [Bacteroidota bacterium]|jgi:hypothetical protein
MRLLLSFFFIFVLKANAFGQESEFKTFENGLIYNPITMQKLGKIVDSLQLKYRFCEVGRTYRARYQAVGSYIKLTEDIERAENDIFMDTNLEVFLQKNPKAHLERDLLLITEFNNQAENDSISKIRTIPIQGEFDHQIPLNNNDIISYYAVPLTRHWVTNRNELGELEAFYISRQFESKAMAVRYGHIAQFVECMVDTTTQVLLAGATREFELDENDKSKTGEFLKLVNTFDNKPNYEKYRLENGSFDYEKYGIALKKWDSLRLQRLDNELSKTLEFKKALDDAVQDALASGLPNSQLEYYAGKYYSKSSELLLKRKRAVLGAGSMDAGARIHTRTIAVLAAETANWEVFLRSHLDILNDRLDHLSDQNSYALNTRETYIKELELLGIDVPNLMLGICLRIENPSQNHYYGDVGRVGRALAETGQTEAVEKLLLETIADPALDDYNRLLTYHLFLTYNLSLKDELKKTENDLRLKRICKEKLPRYLYEKIVEAGAVSAEGR